MDLIRSLDDPSKFVRKDGVAVFRPHSRKFPAVKLSNGQEIPAREVKVTDDDLQEIADNVNKVYRDDGQLVKLVIGHREFDPKFPEKNQPHVAGYARNYRASVVERPGGKAIRLTHDEYIHCDKPYSADVLNGQYPERSPEYNPDAKLITGVALLTRDQSLPLGTVSYNAGANCFTYAMGSPMNDQTAAPGMDEVPDDDAGYQQFQKYMKKYSAMMGPMNGTPPVGGTPSGPPIENYAAGNVPLNYNADPVFIKLQEDTKRYQAEAETAKKAAGVAECRRLLDAVVPYHKFDYGAELSLLTALPVDQRSGRIEYIRTYFAPLPAGEMIRLADNAPTANYDRGGGGAPAIFAEPPNFERALEIVRTHPGTSWEKAKEMAAGKA